MHVFFFFLFLRVLGLTAIEAVFQSISGRLPEKGRKKREMMYEKKRERLQKSTAVAQAMLSSLR